MSWNYVVDGEVDLACMLGNDSPVVWACIPETLDSQTRAGGGRKSHAFELQCGKAPLGIPRLV